MIHMVLPPTATTALALRLFQSVYLQEQDVCISTERLLLKMFTARFGKLVNFFPTSEASVALCWSCWVLLVVKAHNVAKALLRLKITLIVFWVVGSSWSCWHIWLFKAWMRCQETNPQVGGLAWVLQSNLSCQINTLNNATVVVSIFKHSPLVHLHCLQ